MCLGISGSPMLSFKSKADALKYAIEFTAAGEYPNKVPDMTKAKELFVFICENVQLPDVETDQLSSSLSGFTSLMEKLSKKNEETQDKVNEAVGTVEGFVEGEEPVKKEPHPGNSALRDIYKSTRAHTLAMGLKNHGGESLPGHTREVFLLNGQDEILRVTLEYNAKAVEGE